MICNHKASQKTSTIYAKRLSLCPFSNINPMKTQPIKSQNKIIEYTLTR